MYCTRKAWHSAAPTFPKPSELFQSARSASTTWYKEIELLAPHQWLTLIVLRELHQFTALPLIQTPSIWFLCWTLMLALTSKTMKSGSQFTTLLHAKDLDLWSIYLRTALTNSPKQWTVALHCTLLPRMAESTTLSCSSEANLTNLSSRTPSLLFFFFPLLNSD